MVGPSTGSSSLKEYLKRYENNEEKEKKKRKRKTKPDMNMNGVLVVDEDPVWQKPVELPEEDNESEDEEKPQVDEDIEVKRVEALKNRRNISPPRKRRARNDTPSPSHELEDPSMNADKAKPFARTRDDPDLDNTLKDRVRWGDPMPHLVKNKNHLEVLLQDIGDNERMKESGFIVPQQIPNHSWLKRGFDAAPNRYGIKPGRHWDGVDYSTGYEKQMFTRKNQKRATQREAYLWSVAAM